MLNTNISNNYLVTRANWHKNHRHHGGVSAVARCWFSTMRLEMMPKVSRDMMRPGVDCFVSSVIPALSSFWLFVMSKAIPEATLFVGDCSGGFSARHRLPVKATIWPLVNGHHGAKIDLMMSRMSTAEFVVVSDDDVFWLDNAPWQWAMDEFRLNPKLAVVSLVPRERFQWNINGAQYTPMGSYNLIIRREIWCKEELDLRPRNSPCAEGASYKGVYDTADYANVQLLKRGYSVSIAPREIRERHMVEFKGVSSGLLVAQKEPERRRMENSDYDPGLLARCAHIARGLAGISAEVLGADRDEFIAPRLLESVTEDAERSCDPKRLASIRDEVDNQVAAIASAVFSTARPLIKLC